MQNFSNFMPVLSVSRKNITRNGQNLKNFKCAPATYVEYPVTKDDCIASSKDKEHLALLLDFHGVETISKSLWEQKNVIDDRFMMCDSNFRGFGFTTRYA